MKVSLVMVSSADGFTTKGSNPDVYSWTSPEDKEYFFSLIESNNLIVMGRKTYESVKGKIRLKRGKLRIVMTSQPENFIDDKVEGQLEFSEETPQELVQRVSDLGYRNLLLVGGADISKAFFEAKLIDELFLTVEPVLFGKGKPLLADSHLPIQLELETAKQLNQQGSMLLTYKIFSL